MTQCTQPDCPGYIEDGFCNTCGTAEASAPPPPAAGQPPAPRPGPYQPGPPSQGPLSQGPLSQGPPPPRPPAPPGFVPPTYSQPGYSQPAPPPGGYQPGYSQPSYQQPGSQPSYQQGYQPSYPPSQPSRPVPAAPPPRPGSVPSGPVSAGSAGSGSLVPGFTTSGRSGSGRIGSGRTSSGSSRRGMLGVGLVEVPAVPYRDPASAVQQNPEVPENRRFCSSCGDPVGRGRGDRPARTEGYCRKCGHPFSFTPKLMPGELVGGQYEVLGCLAHGGLGWVYLARDRNVSDRWVVLKGLLDTGDADAMAAAAAERAFLAEVEHPNIVKIYNFVQHPDPQTGMLVGYIVMEYVGGRSLKDRLVDVRNEQGEHAVLPLDQTIAYGLEVLRALGYLHGVGLIYCDFKPDNAIQSEEQLKLIDLGGVRRSDDPDSAIFGTVGYQAPEISEHGPSVPSDLYTVGRALAVLSFPFRGYTTRFASDLPARHEVPLLARYESYDRLLRRATHRDPGRRFQDAAEMAEQLTGVLREVLAIDDGQPRPAPSAVFGPEQLTVGGELHPADDDPQGRVLVAPRAADAAAALPAPLAYGSDPAAGFLAGLTVRDPAELVAALDAAPVSSPEVTLMRARGRIQLAQFAEADALLDRFAAAEPGDWRVEWYRAVGALAAERFEEAAGRFDMMYDLLPGEPAPKLGLAFARECGGAGPSALPYYDLVWRTDRGHVSAAFGLARVHLAAGDRAAAVAALDAVPTLSSQYIAAQVAAVAATVRGRRPAEFTPVELMWAGQRLDQLRLDAGRRGRLAAEVLETALRWVTAAGGRPAPPAGPLGAPGMSPVPAGAGAQGGTLLGAPLTERGVRGKLEVTYRGLARLVDGADDRHDLVDRANAVRPRTLF